MISDDADTLAEDVVVDLIIGAGDLLGGGACGRSGVGCGLLSCGDGVGGAVAEGIGSLGSSAVDVLVGLVLHGVEGAGGDWCALRTEKSDQQGEE